MTFAYYLPLVVILVLCTVLALLVGHMLGNSRAGRMAEVMFIQRHVDTSQEFRNQIQEMEQQAKDLQALVEAHAELLASLGNLDDLDRVLNIICLRMREDLEGRYTAILFPAGEYLKVAGAAGLSVPTREAFQLAYGESLVQFLLRGGGKVSLYASRKARDLHLFSRYPEEMEEILLFPIKLGTRLVAVGMAAREGKREPFGKRELYWAESLSGPMAFCIAGAKDLGAGRRSRAIPAIPENGAAAETITTPPQPAKSAADMGTNESEETGR